MKTTSYNAEKEIRVGILVAVFAISIFTAVRVKELQLNEATNSNETRSSQILTNYANTPLMPVLDARLIDEPVPAVESLMKNIEYKASEFVKAEIAKESQRFLNDNEAAVEVEAWMTAIEYKAADFVNAEMALEADRFLNNNNEVFEAEAWMTAIEYKATDFANAEIASEAERFLNNNYEAVETGTTEGKSTLAIE